MKCKENPFKEAIAKLMRKKFVENNLLKLPEETQMLIDTDTGELSPVISQLKTPKLLDIQQFTKIYHKTPDLLMDLKPEGIKLLGYIIKNLEEGKDYIILDKEGFISRVNYKNVQSVYKGIKELEDNKVIAKSNITSKYWINPYYIFNGQRQTLFT